MATRPLFWVVADVWEGRTSGTPRPSLGVQVLALLSFLVVQKNVWEVCASLFSATESNWDCAMERKTGRLYQKDRLSFFIEDLVEKRCANT